MDNQNNSPTTPQDVVIDVGKYSRILMKRKIFIILGALLCGIVGGLYSYLMLSPVYEAKVMLRVIEASSEDSSYYAKDQTLDDTLGKIAVQPVQTMNTYLGQLKSEAVLNRMHNDLRSEWGNFLPGSISASIVDNTNLIELSVRDKDPQLAADIANSMSQQYIQLLSEQNQNQITRSLNLLNEEGTMTQKRIDAVNGALLNYEQNIATAVILKTDLAKKKQEISELEKQDTQYQAELAQINNSINLLNKKLRSATKGTKLYVATRKQLNEQKILETQIVSKHNNAQQLLNKRNSELYILNDRIDNTYLTIGELQGKLEILKNTSKALNQNIAQVAIYKSIKSGDSNMVIVSEATAPTAPVGPNRARNTALATLIGAVLFALLAILIEITPKDKNMGQPTLNDSGGPA
ncbi:MAG: GumC family protein [Ignavibacteriales bacterium]